MAQRSDLGDSALQELLALQDGVVARRQLLDAGARSHDLDRMVRRRELRRVHPGIYVAHTGELTRRQREWTAILSARIRAGDISGAFSRLADVVHARRTTVPRLLDALAERERITGRRLIVAMLTDIGDGLSSVLERGYRDRVERAHGLPTATRQRVSTATGSRTHQDVYYRKYSLVVELDGHLFHSSTARRDADAGRDLAELAASGAPTARVTYGLVFATPCRTAAWIAAILRTRGWRGTLLTCPRCPPGVTGRPTV
ncbi:hypothetical protein [Ruania zhangjianzhongii]|uniref:hypothetical protein n=1 Tax=Ruania zhangjianzhongii TaxID=2603206 RepID=UPI0011CBB87E|nr:hypothetical protein [Ruania zhangjianzhongii]